MQVDTTTTASTQQHNTHPRWLPHVVLVGIMLLGFYFRILGLQTWDHGTLQHPDERFYTSVAADIRLPASVATYFDAATSPANPHNVIQAHDFFVYGTFPMLLTRMVAIMLSPPSPPDPAVANGESSIPRLPQVIQRIVNPNGYDLTRYSQIYRVGRYLAMLFDLASLLVISAIGKRVVGWRAGLLATGLAAALVLHIQQAHFFLDPAFSTFFCLLALYALVRVAQGGGLGWYSSMGMAIGAAAATRITLWSLGILAIVAMLMGVMLWRRRSHTAASPRPQLSFSHVLVVRGIPLLLLAGLFAMLTFRSLQPYAFTGATPTAGQKARHAWLAGSGFWDIRPNPRYIQDMTTLLRLHAGEEDSPPMQQWVNRPDYLYPLTNLLLWGMGPLAGIVAWGGWLVFGIAAVVQWRRGKLTMPPHQMGIALLWLWVAIFFALQGGQFTVSLRYMLPIAAPLLILGAWLLTHHAPTRLRFIPQLQLGLTVVVVMGTLVWAYAFTRIYTRPHTRIAATQWILQHGQSGVRIAHEWWDDPLPLDTQAAYQWLKPQHLMLPTYAQDTPIKYTGGGAYNLPGLLDMLVEVDYITLTSSRVYRSIERLPTRYPVTKQFYQQLFNGNLGFELVADITSYPTLGGTTIPDYMAEESFHVYDHPRVLIFRKVAYDRERAEHMLTHNVNWDELTPLPVGKADQAPTGLKLTTSDYPRYREAGTWRTLFDPQRIHPIVAPVAWLLVLEAMGLAMFVVLFRLLPWLPDRGWSLARTLRVLFVAWGAWLKGSLAIAAFTPRSVWMCAGLLMGVGVIVGIASRHQLVAYWYAQRKLIVTGEVVFLTFFIGFLILRWYNPDLWQPWRGGEKPMEFAYLNAILQSGAFPPYDPWYAGGYINYYYFGFVVVGAMIHLTGVIPSIAFNLAVPTIAALTALAAWGAVYNLLAPMTPSPAQPNKGKGMGARIVSLPLTPCPLLPEGEGAPKLSPSPASGGKGKGDGGNTRAIERQRNHANKGVWRAHLSALLAPVLVLLTGNLVQAVWYLNGYAAEQTHRPEWAFWDATRIVPGTVNEFPFFTFLFADMHPHMLVMPFSLALVGVLVAMIRWLDWHTTRLVWVWFLPLLAMAAVLVGTLHVTNTWDYPTYMGLTLATLALVHTTLWRRHRQHPQAQQRYTLLVNVIGSFVLAVVVVVGGGYLLYLPFHSHFASESSGVMLLRDGMQTGLWQQVWHAERTTLHDTLLIAGLWLFVVVSSGVMLLRRWLRMHYWQPMLAVSAVLVITAVGLTYDSPGPVLTIPLLIGAVYILWRLRHLPPRLLLPIIWATTALAILVGIEIVVVRGDVGRMNTVFKFGLHAWILFALATAIALPWLWQRTAVRRAQTRSLTTPGLHWLWRGAVVVLMGATFVYPITATPARLTDRYSNDVPHSLDGIAFFGYVDGNEQGVAFPLSEDAAAIAWIQQHITGTPIILEAHQPSYRWGGRIATYTGLPTLLGWEWHQRQQRNLVDIQPILGWEQVQRPAAMDTRTVIDRRMEAIATIYNTHDPLQAIQLLNRYGIEYVYVGGVEHAIYDPLGVAKFATLANVPMIS